MPLTEDRNTPLRAGQDYVYPVAANVTIFAGALVMLNAAGDATRGAAATGQIAVGRAEHRVSGGPVAAVETIRVQPGVFRWRNSAAADAITKAHIGDTVFIADDDQVALTNGGNTRSPAGVCVMVDPQGVWVRTGL